MRAGKPFTITMNDGHSYDVPHQDYVAFPPKGQYCVVFDDVGHAWFLSYRNMSTIQTQEENVQV